jgi:ribonuclease E
MTTKMLINATRSQMLRVAIVEGTILQEYQVEIAEGGLTRGNIYRGTVANLQPSLNAAFIDIGEERHAFLPVADVLPSAYHRQPPAGEKRPRIDQVLEKGKPILVQVTKDGVGQKGAALTTNIALAGRYLVLTPFDEVRGISRKAEDDDERKTVRERLKRLALPDGYGVIVRTNGLEQNQTTLTKDLNALLRLWRSVQSEGQSGQGPRLVYSDQDLVVQMLRDYLDVDIAQVVVDHDEVFAKVDEYMKAFMPRSKTKLIRYNERLPLFSRYRIETQIDRIYERTAPLPGGGSIVIDSTEALTAIDVNSGRATRTADHDESIFNINVEAAQEVARQLRLRDIGGLVVVDFIDMRFRKHQNKLEKVMRDAMGSDKARYSVGRISPNGLLEINRQRIKQALRLRTHRPCPTCQGAASIPTPDFAALRILTRIEARASGGLLKSVTFALHPEIVDALQNGHRRELAAIENDYGVELSILSAPGLARTEERVEWVEREAGSEPVMPRHEPVVRASDLTRADLEETAAAKEKAQAKALPVKQGKRKASEAVPVEKGPNGEDNGESEKRRRRRRRRRRRGTPEEGVATGEAALLQQQNGQDYEDDEAGDEEGDEAPLAAVVAEEPPAPVEKPGRRKQRRRRGGKAEPAAPVVAAPLVESEEEEAEADFEAEGEEGEGFEAEGEATENADNGENGERPGRRRRRRRRGGRGRRKKNQLPGMPGEAEAPGEFPEAAAETAAEDALELAEAEEDQESSLDAERAEDEAAELEAVAALLGDDFIDEPQPPSLAVVPPAKAGRRKAAAAAPAAPAAVDPEGEAAAAPRKKKRTPSRPRAGAKSRNPQDFEEQQPASNESALHQASPGYSPAPAAPIGVITGQGVDRTASMRLRWQWWGGLKGDGAPGEGAPPSEEGGEAEE